MSQITDTVRVQPITGQIRDLAPAHVNQEILQRVTGLVYLGIGLLNSLIFMRFVLRLLDANPANPFAQFIYSTTQPFLSAFLGLISVVTVDGRVLELHNLIAITVYGMIGWTIVQLLRIMFARVN